MSQAIALLSLLLLAQAVHSQTLARGNDKTSQMSLATQAQSEIQQPGQIKSKSTDVEIHQSMLSLSDPKPLVRQRSWDYTLGLSVQEFQPRGVASNDQTTSQFNLGENSKTPLPSLEFGFRAPLVTQDSWRMEWGLGARFAYTSQKAKARFETGFVESDVRLNTMMWGAGPNLSLVARYLPWLRLTAGYEWGRLTYTQASSNDYANFSQRAAFTAWTGAMDVRLNSTWSVFTRYAHRELTKSRNQLELQADNFELGTRIVW